MNEFDLYVLMNIDTDTMASPMKKSTIFLSYIKGELVQDWTKRWVDWMINQYQQGRPAYDPYYWDQVSAAFRNAFQDTGARERAEQKLKNLAWNPESVDVFLSTFESLAVRAGYDLDAQPTMTALASKLPSGMMNHIIKIVRPQNYRGWCDAIRQYHADNTAVNNLRGIQDGGPTKKKRLVAGMTSDQWAHILGVKLPKDPNAMDTSARGRSFKKKAQARLATETDAETQRKEGRCYTCNKQGHLAKDCPDKAKAKKKAPAKARIIETEGDSAEESSKESSEEEEEDDDKWGKNFIKLGRSKPVKTRLDLLYKIRKAERGEPPEEGQRDHSDF